VVVVSGVGVLERVVVRGVLVGRVEDGVKAIVWDASHSVATVDVSFILNEFFVLVVYSWEFVVIFLVITF